MSWKKIFEGRKAEEVKDEGPDICCLCLRTPEQVAAENDGTAILARNKTTGKALCNVCFDEIAPHMVASKMQAGVTTGPVAFKGSLKEVMEGIKQAIEDAADGVTNTVEGDDCECDACNMRRAMMKIAREQQTGKLH